MSPSDTDLKRFGPDEAWAMGSALVTRCREAKQAVTVLILVGSQRVFHAAMPGTSADNDRWVERKARVVTNFGTASLEVYERHFKGKSTFFEIFGLSSAEYAPYGGAIPITVCGSLVGVLSVSGLTSDEDHKLAVEALRDLAAGQRSAANSTSSTRTRRTLPPYRVLRSGQRSRVWIGGPEISEPHLVLDTPDILLEAPNWSLDGDSIYLNGNGQLWRIDLAGQAALRPVTFVGLPPINNDHVLAPDGESIYMSAGDGQIYRGLLRGGAVERVTRDEAVWHFLHGVSPDGRRLAFVKIDELGEPGQLAIMEPHGQPEIVDTGEGHLDGPEWSPDGIWLYFNTERFSNIPGHAQLARVADGGGRVERLVASDTVDWFPHLSPDGSKATYLAFPAGTLGHPADIDVEVRVVEVNDWSRSCQVYELNGGQGSLNVNSWSPDSARFAFVSYVSDND